MPEIWIMGEMLVEIMRSEVDVPFNETGTFLGPFPSGAPAIFIDAAARLGSKAGMIGGVGNDGFGENLRNRMTEDGVDCRYVENLPGSTGVAFITYFSDDSREYIFHIGGSPAVKSKKPENLEVGNDGYFHLMGCSLFMDPEFYEEIIKTMTAFKERGFKISFDPNIRTELLKGDELNRMIEPVMENCSVLLPGKDELFSVSGESDIDSAVKKLFTKYKDLEVVALKLGSKGCRIITKDEHIELEAISITEVDPTGAGDCFDAGFIHGLINGKSLEESGIIASAAGALNASAFGPMEGRVSEGSIREILKGTVYEGKYNG
jgi:sugar/nucleoside kinase (ribokinase family)